MYCNGCPVLEFSKLAVRHFSWTSCVCMLLIQKNICFPSLSIEFKIRSLPHLFLLEWNSKSLMVSLISNRLKGSKLRKSVMFYVPKLNSNDWWNARKCPWLPYWMKPYHHRFFEWNSNTPAPLISIKEKANKCSYVLMFLCIVCSWLEYKEMWTWNPLYLTNIIGAFSSENYLSSPLILHKLKLPNHITTAP